MIRRELFSDVLEYHANQYNYCCVFSVWTKMADQPTDQQKNMLLVWLKTENGSESESETETETDLLPRRILHQRGTCLDEDGEYIKDNKPTAENW